MSASLLHIVPDKSRLNSHCDTSLAVAIQLTDHHSLSASSPSSSDCADNLFDFLDKIDTNRSFVERNILCHDKLCSKSEENTLSLADLAQCHLLGNDSKFLINHDESSDHQKDTHCLGETNNIEHFLSNSITLSALAENSSSLSTSLDSSDVNNETVDDDLFDLLMLSKDQTDCPRRNIISKKDELDILSFIDSIDICDSSEFLPNFISENLVIDEKNSPDFDEQSFSKKLPLEINLNQCIKEQDNSKLPVLCNSVCPKFNFCSSPFSSIDPGLKSLVKSVADDEIKKTNIVNSKGSLLGKALSCKVQEKSSEKVLSVKNALYKKYFCASKSDVSSKQVNEKVINKSNHCVITGGRFHYPSPPQEQ